MAETTKLSYSLSDVTSVVLSDGSGTPKTFSLTFGDGAEDGSLSWTVHFPEAVESTNAIGDVQSIRNGAKTGRSEVTLTNVPVRDYGKHASNTDLIDILNDTGTVSSGWVSVSGTGADGSRVIPELDEGERKRYKCTVTIANRGASGALKGGTAVWDDVDIVPGWNLEFRQGKAVIPTLTLRSSQMAPFWTRTT